MGLTAELERKTGHTEGVEGPGTGQGQGLGLVDGGGGGEDEGGPSGWAVAGLHTAGAAAVIAGEGEASLSSSRVAGRVWPPSLHPTPQRNTSTSSSSSIGTPSICGMAIMSAVAAGAAADEVGAYGAAGEVRAYGRSVCRSLWDSGEEGE